MAVQVIRIVLSLVINKLRIFFVLIQKNAIAFDTGGNINTGEAMRIDSSGNTLIGASSATAGSNSYKLLVQDQVGTGEQLLGLQYSGVVTWGGK